MAKLKLTTRAIGRLPAPHPDGKQTPYWDTELKGFGVLCSGKTNVKSFIVQRDLPGGRTRRVTIGPTNVFELDKARTEAELILADMYKGRDPKAGRRGAANATLRQVLEDYLTARKDLRKKSQDDYRATVERHLASWLDRPMRDITPEMVEQRHAEIHREIAERAAETKKRREITAPAKLLLARIGEAIEPIEATTRRPVERAARHLKEALARGDLAAIRSRTSSLAHAALRAAVLTPAEAKPDPEPDGAVKVSGKAAANGAMRALRVLWNHQAERAAEMPPNPVRRLKRQWFAVERRDRMVRAEELPRFFAAVDGLVNHTARDYLKLLLFTGLRRTEAASLRWDDIDLVERVIRLPAKRTKAGRKLDLPMTDFVRDLLVARRALGRDGPFVFPSDSKSGHLTEPKFPLTEVAAKSGIRISAHDLRRTYITVAEGTDISPLALKALVNHSLGNDVTSGYVQMSAERLREPAQRVCDRLRALCGTHQGAAPHVERLAQ